MHRHSSRLQNMTCTTRFAATVLASQKEKKNKKIICYCHYIAVILTVNEEMRVVEGVSWKHTLLTTSTDVDAACFINAQLGGNHTQQPCLMPRNHQVALNGRSAVIMAGRHGKQKNK